jgi:hypothetical protein
MRSSQLFALSLALSGFLSACNKDGPDIVPVEGTLTYKGKPVPNLRVYFQPDQGRMSWGDTDASGKFKLDYDADYDGAKVGPHTVYVVDASTLDPTIEQPPGGKPPEYQEILAKYGNEQISPKKVEITKAVYDLKLELD